MTAALHFNDINIKRNISGYKLTAMNNKLSYIKHCITTVTSKKKYDKTTTQQQQQQSFYCSSEICPGLPG